jgi:predicted 2-oxoglutarate/Fe(II)-dependent dioxygenase YbiX
MIKSHLNIQTFTISQCETIINAIKGFDKSKSTVYNLGNSQAFRTSENICVPPEVYKSIEERIDFCVKWHTQNLFSLKNVEPIQFLKYDESNSSYFRIHTDSEFIDASGTLIKSAPWRFITTITYLNVEYEGGELVLHFEKDEMGNPLKIKPAIGSTIIFHSNISYPHEVLPVTKGARYSVVKWYGLDN